MSHATCPTCKMPNKTNCICVVELTCEGCGKTFNRRKVEVEKHKDKRMFTMCKSNCQGRRNIEYYNKLKRPYVPPFTGKLIIGE